MTRATNGSATAARSYLSLAIKYAEVSEQLGYEIDAYSIQHEMSTQYGRMVAADDALMRARDPRGGQPALFRLPVGPA